jgi:Tetratricopeptide repeat
VTRFSAADAYYARGIARRKQGDLAGAIADYDQAIALTGFFGESEK